MKRKRVDHSKFVDVLGIIVLLTFLAPLYVMLIIFIAEVLFE